MADGPERTPDGHHIVVDGRRWRATDPSIPEPLRVELVAELMDARRSVRADGTAARARVQAAKVALGERGEPWWDEPTDAGRRERIAAAIVALARHRAPTSTTCPSDAARAVGGEGWRDLMDLTRDVARDLARGGEVEITQKGRALDPDAPWRGPVRIRSVVAP
ncbi:DUF3253 domain-containing protein [Iamia sp. SCSIO 61187]|uniref:DUF3253 domain-containing protein n=1 Tax=Iamia sp. SCSIO 61187 TaxID=2722752 RepID=UPI001C637ECA|nr:DUF3253 domain-containing protein [Iamia sp. SCSIO 61187]QYG91918.1 DUF3253 domain-containing protein [Iamia sp. SCSIO 61187]